MDSYCEQSGGALDTSYITSPRDLPQTPLEQKLGNPDDQRSISLARKNGDYSWRAYSLRWPYLSFMMLLSLCLLAVIEILRQLSVRRNGLTYFASPDASTGLTIAYNYLPTFIGVLYSLLWFFIDSDAKRLESYFQMTTEKAPAQILLLDYSFQSPFLIPIRALRNKHWIIAIISTQFLFVSLVLPGSMGALLNIEAVSLVQSDQRFLSTGSLHQTHIMREGNFANQVNSIFLSPGDLRTPNWTTFDYAVEPFTLSTLPATENETWSAITSVAFAEPRCPRLKVSEQRLSFRCCFRTAENTYLPVTYLSAEAEIENSTDQCGMSISMAIVNTVYPDSFNAGPRITTLWIPADPDIYEGDVSVSLNLTNLGNPYNPQMISSDIHLGEFYIGRPWYKDIRQSCPHNPRIVMTHVLSNSGTSPLDLNTFLDVENFDNNSISSAEQLLAERLNVSLGVFACSAQYYSASAQVTVQGYDGTIQEVELVSNPDLLSPNEFNATAFEYLLDFDLDPDLFRELDIDTTQQYNARLEPLTPKRLPFANYSSPNLWSINNYIDLSIIANDYGRPFLSLTSSFSDFTPFLDQFQEALEWAYRLTFTAAFQSIMASSEPSSQQLSGKRTTDIFALVVTHSFATLIEVILSASILTLAYILFIYSRRRSILRSDPDSISASTSLVADHFTDTGPLQSGTNNLDNQSTKVLKQVLQDYELRYNKREDTIEFIERDEAPLARAISEIPTPDELPFFLQIKGIILITVALTSIIGLLFFFRFWQNITRGFEFTQPFSSFSTQLILSFIPSLTATCIEACAVSIHRDLSILEAYVQFKKSARSAIDSLSLRYSTRPPILVLFLSLKRRHYLISLVSLLSVLTSILNVSMAGLFSRRFFDLPKQFEAYPVWRMSEFPLGFTGLSTPTTLAWNKVWTDLGNFSKRSRFTSDSHAFVPIALNDNETRPLSTRISSTTFGVGASLSCSAYSSLAYNDTAIGLVVDPSNDTMLRGTANFPPPDPIGSGTYTCYSQFQVQSDISGINFQPSYPVRLSMDNGTLVDDDITFEVGERSCYSGMLLTHSDALSLDTQFYLCHPSMELEIFNITHDTDGNVYSYTKLSDDQLPTDGEILMNENSRAEAIRPLMISFTYQWPIFSSYRRTNVGTYDFPGLLMTKIGATENIISIPELATEVFSCSFAVWFSLNGAELLEAGAPGDQGIFATSTVTVREARIIPSPPAFAVSISLLFIYLVSYLLVVFRRRHRYAGPRLPKTIGSIIPWVIHSRMLEDFQGLHYMTTKQRDEVLSKLNKKYEFGRFRGRDGKIRIGIEYDEFILAKGAYGDF